MAAAAALDLIRLNPKSTVAAGSAQPGLAVFVWAQDSNRPDRRLAAASAAAAAELASSSNAAAQIGAAVAAAASCCVPPSSTGRLWPKPLVAAAG